MAEPALDGQWALILGASSGFGAATAQRLAAAGMHIAGVHLDRRAAMASIEAIVAEIEGHDRHAIFYNVNAADAVKRTDTLDDLQARMGESSVRILLHSLAFGTLGPFIDRADPKRAISQRQMEMTLDVMANSLVYWAQDLVQRGMLGRGGKIYGMTSAGDERVIPSYGAVSGAKALLGSHLRQLAAELAPQGIAANALKAGVTPTPALDKIPAADKLLAFAREHNPSGRVTAPEDIADAIVHLSIDDSHWLTGNTINVDGAEDIVVGSMILGLISLPMLFIALGVKLSSRGPVFFRQRRYGLNGEVIHVLKFRSMKVMEDGAKVTQATKNDDRITPFGRFIRRTSLDELPQFIHVVTGQMSIVGPRPHAVAHNEEYRKRIQGYMLRHKVKPGITGWAQVNGWRGETDTLEKMEKRIEHDLEYIRNWALLWDIKIIFLTVFGSKVRRNAY